MTTRPKFLTVKELASELRVHPRTVLRWLHNGDVRSFTVRNTVRIPASELDRLQAGGDETTDLDTAGE